MTEKTYQGYKPFQKKLYAESDKKAKKIASQFLEATGKFKLVTPIEHQKEQYSSRDFEIFHIPSQSMISVETEQKRVWTAEAKWQPQFHEGIDVPHRKIKSKADLFIMINKSGNTLVTVPMQLVKESPCIYKDTKVRGTNTRTKQEPFLRIPLVHKKVKIFHKENNNWTKIP